MAQPTLYMMLGYPGAGKTTAAGVIASLTGAVHLASDKIRLEMFPKPTFTQKEHDDLYDVIDTLTKKLLLEGKDVIYDANLNRYQHRQDKYKICKNTGAQPALIWVRTPQELSKERAIHMSRSHLWPRDEAAGSMFDRLVGVFEKPHKDEPFMTIDGTKITSDYVRQLLRL